MRTYASRERPLRLPVAPVAAMRATASAMVSQVVLEVDSQLVLRNRAEEYSTDLVPGELTNGSATQDSPPAHGVKANLPATHCAKLPFTHAFWPSVQGASAVNVANCAFKA